MRLNKEKQERLKSVKTEEQSGGHAGSITFLENGRVLKRTFVLEKEN